MRFLSRIVFWKRLLAVFGACLLGGGARGEEVVLHLLNGDRIKGTLVSQSTNQVVLSTVWSKEVIVPAAQIESREILPAPAPAPVTPAPTPVVVAPKPAPPTNAVAAAKPEHAKPAITAPPPAPKTRWLDRWKGDLAVGSDLVFGATDRQTYYGRLGLTYARPYNRDPKRYFRNIINYSVDYGRTDGILSANKMAGQSKIDFDVGKKIYVYNLGGVGYDEIRKVDLSYEEGPGAGYHLFTKPNFVLNGELGANYQVEERSDNTTSENYYYRISENMTWKINKQMTLTEKFELFPRAEDLSQYRSRFEATLSYALILNLSLNLTALDSYDTNPANGVTRNEFQLRTSLGIKF